MPDIHFVLTAASTALLIVDMQNDCIDPQGYFGQSGQDVAALR